MKFNPKLLSAAALALVFSMSSCDSDDDKGGNQLSKDAARAEITSFNSTAATDLRGLASADGMEALKDLFVLVDQDDPLGRIAADRKTVRGFLKHKGKQFRNIFVPASINGRVKGDEPFYFEEHTGVYAWDEAESVFVREGDSESIVILFPTEGSNVNNAALEIEEYEEKLFEDEFETYYEPTRVLASLLVDDEEQASLDLDMDFDESGFPVEASIEVSILPYSAKLTFDESNATSSTIEVSLKQGQTVLIGAGVTVKYSNSSKSEESLSKIDGHLQFKTMKLQGTIDFSKANSDEFDLNDLIKLSLLSNNKKIGDIVFEYVNDEPVPYLKYADGSKEKLETAFEPLVEELEDLSQDLSK